MKRVLIFGMGKMYKEKKENLRMNYEIIGFLDNKAEEIRDGSTDILSDIPGGFVYTPEEAVNVLEQDTMIILMSYQFVSMWKQLHGLGISGDRIIFGVLLPPLDGNGEELVRAGRLEAVEDQVIYSYGLEKRYVIESCGQLSMIAREVRRERYRRENSLIDMIAQMPCRPVSRLFGMERGTAVDRYYIERFLEKNKSLIYGNCLEIAEDTYTLRYGGDRVEKANILHVEGTGKNAIKGNLATGEGIDDDMFDCAIITQTLMFIFDIQSTAQNIYRMLRKGGTALITVSGISQISRYDAQRWGSCYGLHEDAMRKLFVPLFGEENVEIHSYGNVKIAAALLYGLCSEDLQEKDFFENDEDYPVIISAVLKKGNS